MLIKIAIMLTLLSIGAAAAEVKISTAEAGTDISTIYTGDKVRDPFVKASIGGAAVIKTGPEDFSIHSLSLRAVMKDASADYAMFNDMGSGISYILRKGKLYDPKGKGVGGVSGTINIKQKMVTLITPDKDVQIFRLGEENKETAP